MSSIVLQKMKKKPAKLKNPIKPKKQWNPPGWAF